MKVFAFEVTSFNGHHCERNGFHRHFAQQQFSKAHVRFGSKADIASTKRDVRFTPKSGRQFFVFPVAPSARLPATLHRVEG
jgi:hypothetical protein